MEVIARQRDEFSLRINEGIITHFNDLELLTKLIQGVMNSRRKILIVPAQRILDVGQSQ